MAMKLAAIVLFVSIVVSVSESRRQAGQDPQTGPDFQELFNKFQEHLKPFMPTTGSFPSFPGMGGGSTGTSESSPQLKREINPNTISEWFNQFQENGNNFSGNLPFKPPTFGSLPFGGSSGSSGSSQNENQNS